MQGQILEADAAGGLVLGTDGGRYRFAGGEWKGSTPATAGVRVDFVAAGETAEAVFPLPGQAAAQQPVAARPVAPEGNSVLLGGLGIGCLALSFAIPVVPLIGALILGLMGADNAKRFNNETGLVLSRIAWIGAVVLGVLVVGLLIFAAAFLWPVLLFMWQVTLYLVTQGQVTA